uniref:BamA/TamA family outer membrane protein n=1 Tax=Sphingosinicella sp. CPCC 101087 TaxID=2497754 RepID=UPI0013EB0BCE
LEITQEQGSAPDRVVLGVAVEERATGELQVSGGYSSEEGLIGSLSIRQRNFRGLGQELRSSISYSGYSKSVELGFTEPALFDRNIAVGFDLYRRDYSSYYTFEDERQDTYQQVSTGGQLRAGLPLNEHVSLALRYGLVFDDVSLDETLYYTTNEDGVSACDPILAGRYLCDAIGSRLTSSVGYSLLYSTLNNSVRPSRGERVLFSQDFAGLGGDTKYLRTRISADKYWQPFGQFIFSLHAEGGAILGLGGAGDADVRLTDRFFLGSPQLRGFDIRGVGPRVQRIPYLTDEDGNVSLSSDRSEYTEDSIGGRYYYLGRAELEIPLGRGARDLGLRPSIFADIGALWGVATPTLYDLPPDSEGLLRPQLDSEGLRQCITGAGVISSLPADAETCPTGSTLVTYQVTNPFREFLVGNSPRPRLSIGIGVNWNSPFGPFRIDVAHALLAAEGDDTKLFTFNIGTAF